MDVPRFNIENINPRFVTGNVGDAFQEFTFELLLRELPTLHSFPGGGKDGAIDLIESSDSHRVVECKVVARVETCLRSVVSDVPTDTLSPAEP